MKKQINKLLSSILVAIMILTAAPLSGFVGLNFDWLDFSQKASAENAIAPTLNIKQISKDGNKVTVGVDLTSGEFNALDFRFIMSEGVTCDSIIVNSAFYSSSTNPATGNVIMISSSLYSTSGTFITAIFTVPDDKEFSISGTSNGCAVTVIDADGNVTNTSVTPSVSGCVTGICESEIYISGKCGDNVTYTFNKSTGLLTISGSGDMYNYGHYESPFYFNKSIKKIVIESGVISIGDKAFEGCTSLSDITLGNVTSIGNQAFAWCINLDNIIFPESIISIDDDAFALCSLKEIYIPKKLTSISATAFNCFNFTNDIILKINAEGLDEIDESDFVFLDSSIESIVVDEKNPVFDSRNHCNAIIKTDTNTLVLGCKKTKIPESVNNIGKSAFLLCTGLTNIVIPESVKIIGDYAFECCTGLTSASISNGVTSIGEYAFIACVNLTSITITNTVTSIGSSAFNNCIRLTSVTIPDSVTSIGNEAFCSCDGLTSIVVDKENEVYDSRSNCNAIIETSTNTLIQGCKNTAIPNSVTSIGDHAFYYCKDLTSITIPDSVTSIGRYAFFHTSLTSITIPNSVTSIGDCAFHDCSKLKDIYYNGTEEQWNNISIGSYNTTLKKATIHFKDTVNPTGSISSTNNVASSQTVTLSLSDNVAVAGYYWGTSSTYSNNTYTATSSSSVTKTISSAGTYYLTVKDTSGNVSTNYSITFYKTILDANGGTVSPTSVLTKSGNSFTFPTPTRSGYTYGGWSTSSTATSGVTTLKPTSNSTYFAAWTYIDSTNPTGSISSTNNVASSQTVTLSLSDNVGVAGYYWGTSSTYSNNTYTATSSSSATKTISSAGTYYLTVKDTSGNVSTNYSITFYKTTLNANGGSVTPTSVLTKSGNSFTFPTPVRSGYSYSGWSTSSTATSGVTTLKPTVNTTYYAVWKSAVNIYNLGEETYSFENYSDDDSEGGHCFGMSSTSSGYYIGALDVSEIGISSSQKLYTLKDTKVVKKPVCYYQKMQGRYSLDSTVAGGSYYKTRKNDISSDWSAVINYVKNHEYDNKGLLQIGFRCSYGGHAINFLRYEIVNGQERIYAYDNNFPDTETYFYKNSSGKIMQAPYSTFSRAIDCIALRDMSKYFSIVDDFDPTRYIYAKKDAIRIEDSATEYPIDGGIEMGEYVMYEIPDGIEQITIVPLENNADFEYLDETYSFGAISDDTVGRFTLVTSDDETQAKPSFEIGKKTSVSISDIEVKYKNTFKLIPTVDCDEEVEYTTTYTSSNPSVVTVDKDGNITTHKKGSATITCTVKDENGKVLATDTCNVTVKFTFVQWLIWILLFGFLWY